MIKSENNKTETGMFLSEIAHPNIIRIAVVCGLDFLIIDCEHGYFDYSQVASLASVANGYQLPVIVRIPGVSRECIQKYLDAGVDGLLVPMLETREQAESLVMYGRYAPEGKRGISTMRPHSNYNPGALGEYMKKANARVKLFAQIETKTGVSNADAIAGVPGINGLFVGPNDLAGDLGTPGSLDTEDMEQHITCVIDAAKRHHIDCGIISSNVSFLKKWRSRGMSLLSCNSEVGLLKKGISSMMTEMKAEQD